MASVKYPAAGGGATVYASTALGAAAQEITVPSLPAGVRAFRWGLVTTNATGVEDYVRLRPNGLTANLRSDFVQEQGGGVVGAAEATTLWIGTLRASGELRAWGIMDALAGFNRGYEARSMGRSTVPAVVTTLSTGMWLDTATVLSSLVFRCDGALSFAAGSYAWAEAIA